MRVKRLSGFFDTWARPLFFVWIILLSILYSALSVIRHDHYQSGAFDLGIFDQAVWQYANFLYPFNTIKDRFILGDHFTLTLPLLAPLFSLWDDVRILLIFQAIWISISSYAIYEIARLRKFSAYVALLLSIMYSIFYGIQAAVFFDFHPVIIGVGLLAWLAYFFEAKKKKLFVITLILMLLTQENMGIALACLGMIYLFQKAYRKSAILFIVGGLTVSIVLTRVIALLSPIGYQYEPAISHNLFTITSNFFDSSEKLQVWIYSFTGFGLLPLLSPGAIFATFLDLAQYFITGPEYARMWSPLMHHRAVLAVFLVLGCLDALSLLKKKGVHPSYIITICFLLACFFQYFFHHPLNKLVKQSFLYTPSWVLDNDKIVSQVPKNVSVATQQSIVPHLSHRKKIYLAWPREKDFPKTVCGRKMCWWLDFPDDAEYLIIDLHPDQWITQLLETNDHVREALVSMERSGKISLLKKQNEAYLYKVN